MVGDMNGKKCQAGWNESRVRFARQTDAGRYMKYARSPPQCCAHGKDYQSLTIWLGGASFKIHIWEGEKKVWIPDGDASLGKSQ